MFDKGKTNESFFNSTKKIFFFIQKGKKKTLNTTIICTLNSLVIVDKKTKQKHNKNL